jgi:hypothetical protein
VTNQAHIEKPIIYRFFYLQVLRSCLSLPIALVRVLVLEIISPELVEEYRNRERFEYDNDYIVSPLQGSIPVSFVTQGVALG